MQFVRFIAEMSDVGDRVSLRPPPRTRRRNAATLPLTASRPPVQAIRGNELVLDDAIMMMIDEWKHCEVKNLERDTVNARTHTRLITTEPLRDVWSTDAGGCGQSPVQTWLVIYTLCLKKVPTFQLSVTSSNLNRFSKIFTAGSMKFATKLA